MLLASGVLAFEDFRFNVRTRELLRVGTDGSAAPVALGSRAADLLLVLLSRPGELVTKNEILEAVWPNATVEDSNLSAQIAALRRALDAGRSGASWIQTVPGRGYRFTPQVTEPVESGSLPPVAAGGAPAPAPPAEPASDGGAPLRDLPSSRQTMSAPGPAARPFAVARVPLILLAGIGAAAVVALVFSLWHPGSASRGQSAPTVTGTFDASLVPLVNDDDRSRLADYRRLPDQKAVAISAMGFGFSAGAPDLETAKQEAMQRCANRGKEPCRLYAIGMDVIWPRMPLPLRADIRETPLDVPLDAAQLPTLTVNQRTFLTEHYVKGADHRALAIGDRKSAMLVRQRSRAEAIRLAVEKCSYLYQVACLLVSVDGFLTVQFPKSRAVTRIFTLADESEMSDADKQRIGAIYQGPEWRALARGAGGGWYAVAGAASEADAVAGALRSCAEHETECRLHAIGNFRVADETQTNSPEH